MVKAGTQQISLPDIYKMFKTASDEDKIKLMNTYANLGERLGERDKDIDYRRTQGDKTALTEKTYTEGIGDVLGSAWDYTKQGAETAWDYTKQGAGKLRDLVMNDLLKGEQAQEEDQLPVNDTPLPWEVGRRGFVGSRETVEGDWESTDLGTDKQLPWEGEGNAFVGSKENADIDPLDGGMSRDPSVSLFELKNALENEVEPESEEETLTPEEQRFLGVEPEKEQVVESPMARRMRERLEKLTAQQEQYAANPDARWSDLYNIDPERAKFDYGREQNALNLAADLAMKQANLESKYSPDSVRFKLASRSNAISSQLNGLASNDPAYKPLLDEQKRIKLELAKDNPSIKSVYAEPSLDDEKDRKDEKDEKDVGDVANQPPTYLSIQSDIGAATKENFEAVASKVADDKGVAKLSDEQAKRVDDLLAERKKKLFPPKAPTNSQVVDKMWGDMDATTQKSYSVPTSLYNAGVSNYGQGLYGTAIQNFIKAANPGEAVMADDVTMANKGQVSPGLLAILKRIGYDATEDNVQDIASKLKVTAENSIRTRLDALGTYNLTPEQRKLFITRYMNGVNLGGNDSGKEPKQGKTPAPVVGTVVNGYTFIGGDPRDKNNWEKQ